MQKPFIGGKKRAYRCKIIVNEEAITDLVNQSTTSGHEDDVSMRNLPPVQRNLMPLEWISISISQILPSQKSELEIARYLHKQQL